MRDSASICWALVAVVLVGCPDSASEAPPPPGPAPAEVTADPAQPVHAPAEAPGEAAPESRHCDNRRTLGACQEFPLDSAYVDALGLDMAETVCGAGGGTWGEGPCPTDQRVGRCEGSQGELSSYYSVGERSFTAESAERACTTNDPPGTFLDG